MTITELGNSAVLKSGGILINSDNAPLKTAFGDVLSEKTAAASGAESAPENAALKEYPTLCGCENETDKDDTEITDEDTNTITSCLECEVRLKCEHHINGGNDILADNGRTVTMSKNSVWNETETDDPQPFIQPLNMLAVYDLSNIYLPAEEKNKRRS